MATAYVHVSNDFIARKLKKIELVQRMCVNEDDFLDYLGRLAFSGNICGIEEFFNKCHGNDGKFCPGGRASSSADAEDVDDSGSQGLQTIQRYAELWIGLPGRSSLKADRFSKANLKDYSRNELLRFKRQFQADSRNYKSARKMAVISMLTIPLSTNFLPIAAFSFTKSAIVIGTSAWRTAKIGQQVQRIGQFLQSDKSNKSALETEKPFEFQTLDFEPSLLEAIKTAQKQIDDGQVKPVESLTKEEISSVKEFVNALRIDPEEGLYEEVVQAMKDIVDEFEKIGGGAK